MRSFEYLKKNFLEYVDGFNSDEESVRDGYSFKREHSLRVCENAKLLGHSLKLTEAKYEKAIAGALFHDIGRFEQYRRYQTFADIKSIDHGKLGSDIVDQMDFFHAFSDNEIKTLKAVIFYHNKAQLPEDASDLIVELTKIVRDADKLDIFATFTETINSETEVGKLAQKIGVRNVPEYSEEICNCLLREEFVSFSQIKSMNDIILFQFGWIYDINFEFSLDQIIEKQFIELLFNQLPKTKLIEEVYKKVAYDLKLRLMKQRCK